MSWGERGARIRQSGARFLRFAVVGASNTLVDIAVTNALILFLNATSGPVLLLISVVACATATLNSYILNRRWTFQDVGRETPRNAMARFFAVALVSMGVNTSTFLFLARYLPDWLPGGPLVSLNAAKLAGIGAAFAVSFLGYRFGVFQTDAIREFRSTFRFSAGTAPAFGLQAAVLVAVSAAVRGAYLLLTTAVIGDAVSYGWVADSIATRDYARIDPFWNNLFCYWEAALRLAGLGPVPAAVAASLLPGILLVVPVLWVTRSLYRESAAWVAGTLIAVHPRLVEYSCNGYPETFYLLALAAGIAFLTRVVQGGGARAALGWGICLGLYVCVRNEGLLLFLASIAVYLGSTWLQRRTNPPTRGSNAPVVTAVALGGFLLVTLGYARLSVDTMGSPGFFQRVGSLSRKYSEQLAPREAARETYAADGTLYGPPRKAPSAGERVAMVLGRLPENMVHSVERLPGVLMSPLAVFALLVPVFAPRKGPVAGEKLPLLLMFLFPLLFYPLIQMEPRLFFPMLVPLHVFGAAGLAAFSTYVAREMKLERILMAATVAFAALGIGLCAWRGFDIERNFRFHRELADWVRQEIPAGDAVMGCGYSYVATTGFLAAHRTIPRIWAERPEELAAFAHSRGVKWIVLYERFLRLANPELLPVLDGGIPEFERVHEVRDHRGQRTQVFRCPAP